jgi:hypothetical protein
MLQAWKDEEELAKLEHKYGLAIMASAVFPKERNYWSRVEQNLFGHIHDLRVKLFPSEQKRREREAEVQRIISEYGMEDLMERADPGYPFIDGPHNLPELTFSSVRVAGCFNYFIAGLPESAGKYAGERGILLWDCLPSPTGQGMCE